MLLAFRLAEWLYEDGIGERRAAMIERGRIVECHVERDGDGIAAGARSMARLLAHDAGLLVVQLPDGEQALLSHLPAGIGIGGELLIEVTRSRVRERDLSKRAKCRPAHPESSQSRACTLLERIQQTGVPVKTIHPHEGDALEQAGWSEWCDVAASGIMSFPGGLLRLSLTPAMVVIDVDGRLPAAELARNGAIAAANIIRALGIGGNIIIDLPTLASKAERIAAAQAFDSAMPLPFERTAVNGYGLLQVICPRRGPSIAERWQFTPIASAALALMRRAERHSARCSASTLHLNASPAEIAWITEHPDLVDALSRRAGRPINLRSDPALGIGHGYVA